jgi:hypothetical protein
MSKIIEAVQEETKADMAEAFSRANLLPDLEVEVMMTSASDLKEIRRTWMANGPISSKDHSMPDIDR